MMSLTGVWHGSGSDLGSFHPPLLFHFGTSETISEKSWFLDNNIPIRQINQGNERSRWFLDTQDNPGYSPFGVFSQPQTILHIYFPSEIICNHFNVRLMLRWYNNGLFYPQRHFIMFRLCRFWKQTEFFFRTDTKTSLDIDNYNFQWLFQRLAN